MQPHATLVQVTSAAFIFLLYSFHPFLDLLSYLFLWSFLLTVYFIFVSTIHYMISLFTVVHTNKILNPSCVYFPCTWYSEYCNPKNMWLQILLQKDTLYTPESEEVSFSMPFVCLQPCLVPKHTRVSSYFIFTFTSYMSVH